MIGVRSGTARLYAGTSSVSDVFAVREQIIHPHSTPAERASSEAVTGVQPAPRRLWRQLAMVRRVKAVPPLIAQIADTVIAISVIAGAVSLMLHWITRLP